MRRRKLDASSKRKSQRKQQENEQSKSKATATGTGPSEAIVFITAYVKIACVARLALSRLVQIVLLRCSVRALQRPHAL